MLAFTFVMNYFSYLALKFYSGQQPRASVSVAGLHLSPCSMASGCFQLLQGAALAQSMVRLAQQPFLRAEFGAVQGHIDDFVTGSIEAQ